MEHPQISRMTRRARHNEHPRIGAQGTASEDPQLRRMLATHIHCGQAMTLLNADPALSIEGSVDEDDGGQLTYRCACGFSFDQPQD